MDEKILNELNNKLGEVLRKVTKDNTTENAIKGIKSSAKALKQI